MTLEKLEEAGQTYLKRLMVNDINANNKDHPIKDGEEYCVHHLDGIQNNHVSKNIALMTRSNHGKLHQAIIYNKLDKAKEALIGAYKCTMSLAPMSRIEIESAIRSLDAKYKADEAKKEIAISDASNDGEPN